MAPEMRPGTARKRQTTRASGVASEYALKKKQKYKKKIQKCKTKTPKCKNLKIGYGWAVGLWQIECHRAGRPAEPDLCDFDMLLNCRITILTYVAKIVIISLALIDGFITGFQEITVQFQEFSVKILFK